MLLKLPKAVIKMFNDLKRFFILYRGKRFKHREPFTVTWGNGFIEFDFNSACYYLSTHDGDRLLPDDAIHQKLNRIGFTPLPYN